jgi:multiple sugar transport system substrate-binding protein
MRQTRRDFLKTSAAAGAGAVSGAIGFPMVSRGQAKKLTVWWNAGYYKEEDQAMEEIAREFRETRKVDLDISYTIQDDLIKKIIAAVTVKRPPDVAFCFYNDWELIPKYAWEDKLHETTDLINKLKPRYNEKFLPVAYVQNNVAKKRAYYGVPIEAQIMHIHYWRDLLKEVALPDEPDKIPLKWDDYWGFWKKAQDALRKKDPAKYGKTFGIGMTESTKGTDTLYNFEMALLSFGGQLLSDDGRVVADQPQNRAAIIKTVQWFGELYNSGYVPPDAVNWTDGDNNANFHSKAIVMTPNPSLSIPAHHFFNSPDNYFNKMATVEWPDGPDGKKATYMIAVKTIMLPKDGVNKNPELAKEFVDFVLEPARFAKYIKGANGRWFPAFTDVARDPFFAKGQAGKGGPVDYHIPLATKLYLERPNKVFDHYKHPAKSQEYAENTWGKAMARTNVDKWTAERAADEAIGRLKTIFTQWK